MLDQSQGFKTYYKLIVGNAELPYSYRCIVNNKNFDLTNTKPPTPDNELEEFRPSTRAAIKMLDRLVSNDWADFNREGF